MEVKERFKEVLRYYHLNANAFARSIDSPSTSIRNVLNGQNKPGFDMLRKILLKYREINAFWLLTGEGQMLNNDSEQNLILNEPIEPYGKSVKEILRDKDRQIAMMEELLRLKG